MVRNFTIEEFIQSPTASKLGIDNSLPSELLENAEATLEMMQNIRDHLSSIKGKDIVIHINSGYRCPELNVAVGGSKTSDHVKACAVDFEAPAFGTPTEICKELSRFVKELGIGQLINEFPDRNGWVHVSTKIPAKAINRVITISGKGVSVGI